MALQMKITEMEAEHAAKCAMFAEQEVRAVREKHDEVLNEMRNIMDRDKAQIQQQEQEIIGL